MSQHQREIITKSIEQLPKAKDAHIRRHPDKRRLLKKCRQGKLLGTENIIRSLARNCIDLQVICVNYVQSTNNFEIERPFVFLLHRCRKLKEVILNGLFVNKLVVSIRNLGYYVCDRDDILVAENKHFFLPGPQNSLDNVNLEDYTILLHNK